MRRIASTTAPDGARELAPALRIDGVTLAHDARPVLRDLSLALEGGAWHALLGRSGVGKSSLLRLLAGLDRPDAGTIGDGRGRSLAGRVTWLAQDDGLLPWLNARDNVRLGPRLRGTRDRANGARADALLDRVGLARWRDVRPDALSGGMRQRVALARTLLEDRSVVLMDEPFSRLDAVTRDELQRLAFELLDGRTVVLVTHDPLEALALADTVSVLHPLAGAGATRTTTSSPPGHPPRSLDDAATREAARTLRRALASGTPREPDTPDDAP